MTRKLEALLRKSETLNKALQSTGTMTPYVFVRMVAEFRGGPKKPQPIVSFGKVWRAACREACCPGRLQHNLRRTAVRSFVRSGIPERVAMAMTGHKTPSVFQRYNIVTSGDPKEAAPRLDRAAIIGSASPAVGHR